MKGTEPAAGARVVWLTPAGGTRNRFTIRARTRTPRPVSRAAAGAHDGPLLVVEQPGQQRAVILDRVSELGHMLRQPRVDALGDGRDIGPDGGHHLGIALVTDIGWMTHT
jgi:hypothetical protein